MEPMQNPTQETQNLLQPPAIGDSAAMFDSEDTMKDKFLTFWIGDEEYGMGIEFVTEIIGVQKITKVPDMPHFIKGVINLRGRIIPVIDVRTRFGLPERAYDERTCIVVIHVNNQTTGMIVDQVNEVSNIAQDQIESAQTGDMGGTQSYIMGIGKTGDSVKILLHVERFMSH
jgi:purine-binding chemotaxis protein CheW